MLKILTSGAISGFPPDTAPTSISALAFISSIGLCLGAMRVWALTGAEGSSKGGERIQKLAIYARHPHCCSLGTSAR
jgi:hypothetical protein